MPSQEKYSAINRRLSRAAISASREQSKMKKTSRGFLARLFGCRHSWSRPFKLPKLLPARLASYRVCLNCGAERLCTLLDPDLTTPDERRDKRGR